MDIEVKRTGVDGLYVVASGRMDLDNAVEYGTVVKDTIEDSDEKIMNLTLDFNGITFISSFGLKVVLELYKLMQEQNGKMKLTNVSEVIMDSFRMVGFDKFLEVE